MKPKLIKKLLMSEIRKVAANPHDYCYNPDIDFTRTRKLPMEKILSGVIGMESGLLTNELLDVFHASAFIQQRIKIKPEAFKHIFLFITLFFIPNTIIGKK